MFRRCWWCPVTRFVVIWLPLISLGDPDFLHTVSPHDSTDSLQIYVGDFVPIVVNYSVFSVVDPHCVRCSLPATRDLCCYSIPAGVGCEHCDSVLFRDPTPLPALGHSVIVWLIPGVYVDCDSLHYDSHPPLNSLSRYSDYGEAH